MESLYSEWVASLAAKQPSLLVTTVVIPSIPNVVSREALVDTMESSELVRMAQRVDAMFQASLSSFPVDDAKQSSDPFAGDCVALKMPKDVWIYLCKNLALKRIVALSKTCQLLRRVATEVVQQKMRAHASALINCQEAVPLTALRCFQFFRISSAVRSLTYYNNLHSMEVKRLQTAVEKFKEAVGRYNDASSATRNLGRRLHKAQTSFKFDQLNQMLLSVQRDNFEMEKILNKMVSLFRSMSSNFDADEMPFERHIALPNRDMAKMTGCLQADKLFNPIQKKSLRDLSSHFSDAKYSTVKDWEMAMNFVENSLHPAIHQLLQEVDFLGKEITRIGNEGLALQIETQKLKLYNDAASALLTMLESASDASKRLMESVAEAVARQEYIRSSAASWLSASVRFQEHVLFSELKGCYAKLTSFPHYMPPELDVGGGSAEMITLSATLSFIEPPKVKGQWSDKLEVPFPHSDLFTEKLVSQAPLKRPALLPSFGRCT